MNLLNFFKEAGVYVQPDELALKEAGRQSVQYLAWHRVIVVSGILGGLIGTLLGIAIAIFMWVSSGGDRWIDVLRLPPILLVGGVFLGVGLSCGFAPHRFLAGPVGQKWLKLIGTKNVVAARLVCILLALLMFLVAGAFAFAVSYESHNSATNNSPTNKLDIP